MAVTVTLAEVEADGPLDVIADGGEAQVLTVQERPGILFKRYTTRAVDPAEQQNLHALIDLPNSMSGSDRSTVLARTAWPTSMVVDRGRVVGLLLPRAGENYFRVHGLASAPKRVPCDWTYLTYRQQYQSNQNIVSDVPRLESVAIMRLLLDLATTMATLHSNGVVLGDVSSRNILWTNTPGLHAYVIDCDSFHPVGDVSVAATKQTPDWDDPTLPTGPTTQESDVYKLALAAYRAVGAAGAARPTTRLDDHADGVPDGLRSLIGRSVQPSSRPTAHNWVRELELMLRFDGRPVVALAAVPASPVSPPVVAAQRPVITMAPAAPAPGASTARLAPPARPTIPMR